MTSVISPSESGKRGYAVTLARYGEKKLNELAAAGRATAQPDAHRDP